MRCTRSYKNSVTCEDEAEPVKITFATKAANSEHEDVEHSTYQTLDLDEMDYESLYTKISSHKD